jgi:hypothetical protein
LNPVTIIIGIPRIEPCIPSGYSDNLKLFYPVVTVIEVVNVAVLKYSLQINFTGFTNLTDQLLGSHPDGLF